MNNRKAVDTEIQLEQTIDALEIAHQRIDSLLEQNKVLDSKIGELKQECQSLSDENKARWKSEFSYRGFLVAIAGKMAVDTIVTRTHRERNELYRQIVKSIARLLETAGEMSDMDDIPF
jgi:FtsZ-binding cell division protein ZapB